MIFSPIKHTIFSLLITTTLLSAHAHGVKICGQEVDFKGKAEKKFRVTVPAIAEKGPTAGLLLSANGDDLDISAWDYAQTVADAYDGLTSKDTSNQVNSGNTLTFKSLYVTQSNAKLASGGDIIIQGTKNINIKSTVAKAGECLSLKSKSSVFSEFFVSARKIKLESSEDCSSWLKSIEVPTTAIENSPFMFMLQGKMNFEKVPDRFADNHLLIYGGNSVVVTLRNPDCAGASSSSQK